MPIRSAEATWEGTLPQGNGTMKFGSGAFEGAYSFASRFEEGSGTNPEELIGAAHAGCFSMAFSGALSRAGFPPTRVHTVARVHLERAPEGGFHIPQVDLVTEGLVPGISPDQFLEVAEAAKKTCPVSKLLAGATITLEARLLD